MFVLSVILIYLLGVNAEFVNNSESNGVCNVNQVYNTEGQIKIGIVVNECANSTATSWTYVNSAIWTVERLNFLNFVQPLQLGLSIFQTCTEDDYYNPIYKIFKQDDEGFFLGAISTEIVPVKIVQFGDLLDVDLEIINKYRTFLVEAAVKLLVALNYTENVTVYSESRDVLQQFYKLSKEAFVCVRSAFLFEERLTNPLTKLQNEPILIFGGHQYIRNLLRNFSLDDSFDKIKIIIAPFDDTEIHDLPEGSYIIQPTYADDSTVTNSSKLHPTSLLFDIANPIINYGLNISSFLLENCNKTSYKLNCLRNKFKKPSDHHRLTFSPSQILKILKIESQAEDFIYEIFRVENLTWHNFTSDLQKGEIIQSFVNVFSYHIFNKTLMNLEDNFVDGNGTIKRTCPECNYMCINFLTQKTPKTILISYAFSRFGLRSESWVFAFLAISVLGVVFCIAVLVFLIARFCKRDILEGNPFLSLLLLFSVMLMYVSVIPFTLDSDKELRHSICLARALSSTLTYAFAFSLLLSRSILLATASKEVGFMSHVPGPVQSFLTLFIFGVQGALSLQFVNHCEDIFRGTAFVYMMSYNIILLVLLVFICPLNTRAQRNYKEGKYFTVAVVLLACTWSCWIPSYAVFEDTWKDPILCLGLVVTASILLGAIFIPRTYMMTVAAARDRLTSALPSLPATSSIMDVYRASTQPVYDCINVAAINAATIARNNIPPPPPPQPDSYSSLAAPFDDEFDFERCITPNQDKVTRF